MGTLAGGATSGDKLALDASTEQICAPPQHCGAETCTAAALDSHGPTCLALLCPHQVILWAKSSEDYNIANGDSTGDSNISGISEL